MQVEAIETHLSWVFLTDRYVYKLKKPARLPHLDFSTLKARRTNSLTEVRLNRRLAPDVYLGVVGLMSLPDGTLYLGRPHGGAGRGGRLAGVDGAPAGEPPARSDDPVRYRDAR